MKVIITGAGGMLGTDIKYYLQENGINVIPLRHIDLDIRAEYEVSRFLDQHLDADYVINCAAYTNVDGAETDNERAYEINAEGAAILANETAKRNIPIIHFTTDYVYNGKKEKAYLDIDDYDPINYYGYTKLKGELEVRLRNPQHYMFRVQWLYGLWGKNFVKTMLKLADQKSFFQVVNDQVGTLTWTVDIAYMIHQFLLNKPEYGTYNFAQDGYASWADIAREIFRIRGIKAEVQNSSTIPGERAALRPLNSRLVTDKIKALNLFPVVPWQQSLENYLSLKSKELDL